uniref:Gustatory receptor n=1 Tax=Anopheles funestus TaxID=62324 RepID=A0A182S5B6_ANOFN
MHRLQAEHCAYFRDLLADTFRMVIRLSQWCCTVPFPLEPYQRNEPRNSPKYFWIVQALRRLYTSLLFSVVLAVPLLLYYLNDGKMHGFKTPLSITLMFCLQTLLQTGSTSYVLLVFQFQTSFHRFYFDRLVSVLVEFGRPDIGKRLYALRTNILLLFLAMLLMAILVLAALLLRDHSWNNLLKIVIFFTTQMIATSLTLLYMTLFGIVAVLLRQMNETLEIMLYGKAYDEMRTGSQTHPVPVRLIRDEEQTIEKIRRLQFQLLQIVLQMNRGAFGRLLIVMLLTIFVFLNTEMLQLYQGIKAAAFTFDVIGTKLTNSALKFAMLVMFAFSNRLIQRQNLRVLKLLYQLQSSRNSPRCQDITKPFITQTMFFLKNAHQAYGMVPIDMTLVLSVVVGMANILMVLVQFSEAKTTYN